MTAIVGIISPARDGARQDLARRAIAGMRHRGGGETRFATGGDATLAVSLEMWESNSSRQSDAGPASDAGVVVVADATLYYRTELLRALHAEGVAPSGYGAAHLVLAAYRAWGDQCAQHLEGDFAFIIWDSVARRAVAARDLNATRPLFYCETRDGLLLASTVTGLLAAGADAGLDLAHLGEVAAGLALEESRTCFSSISRVPAAHTLVRDDIGSVHITRHWAPPRFESGGRLSLEDGAVVLRDLLTRAVDERLDAVRPTSVWLSGGWDSPAVFGAGMLATAGDVDRVRAVSITYPVGDPGREDELIGSIAARWGAAPHWVHSADIALLDDVRGGAATRDEPFAHVFEHWNRALAKGSRSVEARVALHGNGGDQLFQVSLIYLADLVRRGRWLSLARECRARGIRDVRTLFRWAVQPLLPSWALGAAAAMRGGRRLRSYLERDVPAWITADFAKRHSLHERARLTPARQPGESLGAVEGRYYLTAPYFPRVYTCVAALAREEGVEVRAPLMDSRVIAFAAERPREEKASRRETKRALRAAMRGIIPDDVLAPRRGRTGTTGRLFARALRAAGPGLIDDATKDCRLADLGIVDGRALARAWRDWESGQDANLGVALFLTLQAEFWTRARERTRRAPNAAPVEAPRGLAPALP